MRRRGSILLMISHFIAILLNKANGKQSLITSKELDLLQPYSNNNHGPRSHSHRHIRSLQPRAFNSSTYEIYPSDATDVTENPVVETRTFIEQIREGDYSYGHMYVISNPEKTVSIVEPGGQGGCASLTKSTVENTSRMNQCLLATNAGFFNTHTGACIGDVVSNGRLVQEAHNQNVHFGIKKDSSIFVGYIPDDMKIEVEFSQLVSGVVWLVRRGENFVEQSMKMEASDTQETGSLNYFVNVNSGRMSLGHDRDGHIIMTYVDGHTGQRGINLKELADTLIKWGAVNAINLDGGGSVSAVVNGTMVNYPADICHYQDHVARSRCAREVSTVVCVHEPICEPADCNNHGDCIKGVCHCHGNWVGHDCRALHCGTSNCSEHGVCTQGGCICDLGWIGPACDQICPDGKYGLNCSATCRCHNEAACNPADGSCTCPPGYTGELCDKECSFGFYGDCQQSCSCENTCGCHHVTGDCSSHLSLPLIEAVQCLVDKKLISKESQPLIKQRQYISIKDIKEAVNERKLTKP